MDKKICLIGNNFFQILNKCHKKKKKEIPNLNLIFKQFHPNREDGDNVLISRSVMELMENVNEFDEL